MEDGMILGGAMLSAICDRFAVTGERGLRDQSDKVFRGMQRCATVHGVTGFVARNVCPEDQSSVYINSSRDQVTHFVHGLWRYYHSPLSDDHTRQQIRELLSAVADRMIRFVIPKNDYDFCRADGSRCPLGICRMWNVKPHEAARLPMIYAAAWDVTGEQRFRNQWRRYIAQAVEQSQESVEQHPVYALLQMQCSLEVLHDLEPDQELKHGIAAIMHHLADLGRRNQARALRKITAMSDDKLAMLGPDWRQSENWINQGGYANPQWGPYRSVWHLVREAGESALIPLMDPAGKISTDQQHQLASLLDRIDYDHNSSCGIVYHVAAYWKMQRNLANQMSKD
jgi:hypothetical protein